MLDAIIDGEFDIDWSGEIYGFWFDSDDEQDTLYTDYSGAQDIIVHNICQKTIQRVLLKKTPSEEVEFIREIGALEQEDEPANEEFDALDDDFSETVHEDDAITMPDTQEDMDTPTNLPEMSKTKNLLQCWCPQRKKKRFSRRSQLNRLQKLL